MFLYHPFVAQSAPKSLFLSSFTSVKRELFFSSISDYWHLGLSCPTSLKQKKSSNNPKPLQFFTARLLCCPAYQCQFAAFTLLEFPTSFSPQCFSSPKNGNCTYSPVHTKRKSAFSSSRPQLFMFSILRAWVWLWLQCTTHIGVK